MHPVATVIFIGQAAFWTGWLLASLVTKPEQARYSGLCAARSPLAA